MPLTTTFVDGDATATVHAAHHNALAVAVNELAGGTTGQIPVKASSTDHDVTWTTPSSGGASFVSSAKWGLD